MNPPIVYEDTRPSSQKMIRMIAMVSSTELLPFRIGGAVRVPRRAAHRRCCAALTDGDSGQRILDLVDDLLHLLLDLADNLIGLPLPRELLIAGQGPRSFLHAPLQFIGFSARHGRSSLSFLQILQRP